MAAVRARGSCSRAEPQFIASAVASVAIRKNVTGCGRKLVTKVRSTGPILESGGAARGRRQRRARAPGLERQSRPTAPVP